MLERHHSPFHTNKVAYVCSKISLDQGFEQRLTGNSMFKRQILLCTHYKNRFNFALHYLCLSIQESGRGNATLPFLRHERKLTPPTHHRKQFKQSFRLSVMRATCINDCGAIIDGSIRIKVSLALSPATLKSWHPASRNDDVALRPGPFFFPRDKHLYRQFVHLLHMS